MDLKDLNYPALWVIGLVVAATATAAFITRRFSDQPTAFFGLLVVMALIGAVAYSLVSPVPESEVGGLLIGTLISAFTLVMGWLYRPHRRTPEETMTREHDEQAPPKGEQDDGRHHD